MLFLLGPVEALFWLIVYPLLSMAALALVFGALVLAAHAVYAVFEGVRRLTDRVRAAAYRG